MAARPACPRWSGYAGPAAASPSSGRTIWAGSPPTVTSTSASRGRWRSSSTAPGRPTNWPGSSIPAPPRRSADPLRGPGDQPAARPGLQEGGAMRIAIIAPLVTAIREPQRGGSQAFVSDLARGLAGRGHAVHVYAASGSEIPGAEVIDTGIDPESLAATLYRVSGPAAPDPAPAGAAFASVYDRVRGTRYDVVHNHAFDAPAITLAAGLGAPVVHTLHLPPDRAVAGALRHVGKSGQPPVVAAVSHFQARAW